MRRGYALWALLSASLWLAPLPAPQPVAEAADRSAWLATQMAAADAALLPAVRAEKYADMSKSAFAFFRGSAYLFWLDYGTAAQLSTLGGTAQTRIWLAGDAHTQNFGSFENARGTIVYDLNDFDEAVLADYQLDVWRLSTALVLVMRENGGFSSRDEASILDTFSQRYLDTLSACVGSSSETTVTFTASSTYGKLDEFLTKVADKRSRKKLLDTYTQKDGRGVRFLSPRASADLADVPTSQSDAIKLAMPAYGASLSGGIAYSASYFAVKSVAQRLHAGLGSLGTARYYVLIEGPTTGQDDDIILDVKAQAAPSAYRNVAAEARTATDAASTGDPARRVVTAARSLANYADDLLGTMPLAAGSHSVRERSPWKDDLDTTILSSVERMSKLVEQWAAILAYAHARADKDSRHSSVPYDFEAEVGRRTHGKHADFRALVRSIALANASQVSDDWQSFLRSRRSSH